jgi:hypothetical protein
LRVAHLDDRFLRRKNEASSPHPFPGVTGEGKRAT